MVSAQRTFLDVSYVLLVLGTICATLLSCVALISQAVRTSEGRVFRNNFNALVIGASYIILAVVSLFFCINRSIAIRLRLQRISKHHKLIRTGDVPSSVYDYITKEYVRTCVIAHQSLPKEAFHPGWGRPGLSRISLLFATYLTEETGTPYEGIRFRRALLGTIQELGVPLTSVSQFPKDLLLIMLHTDILAHNVIPTMPPLKPQARMIHHFRYILPLLNIHDDGLTALHYYDSVIQLARYSRREPTEEEFEYGMHVVEEIWGILNEVWVELNLEGSSTQLDNISQDSLVIGEQS
ncbi:hypothetical protein D9758_000489 [Tetrapyrgos nigripes]|uniref:Defect at low temperature protein 1 n=1 Tax=Tetrapyrgos nigripes TaxID=182062 RepID=A0A8H5H1X4_9AGAR|nr:hypothetical protein D9758_000489 [Tetrapyrgos nigripes]